MRNFEKFARLILLAALANHFALAAGRIGQSAASSADLLSESKAFGTKNVYKLEYVTQNNNAALDILPVTNGPGYVENIFLACRYQSTFNVYYDGEETPTISVPVTAFFAATYVDSQPVFATRWFSGNGQNAAIGVMTYLPIPFGTSIRIEIVNTSGQAATIWSMVTYNTGVPNTWPRTRRLRVAAGDRSNVVPYEVVSLVDVSGLARGRLAGLHWVYDGFPGNVSNKTAPLEGDMAVYVDGGGTPVFISPGTEDFFGMSGYFLNFTAGTNGMSGGDYALTIKTSVTWGGLRMFIKDPIGFTNALKVTWENGHTGQPDAGTFTGNSTLIWAVWYYTE